MIYFFIYSCRKKLSQARRLYSFLQNKIPHVYIVYGDPTLEELYRLDHSNHHLILRCNDDYTSLSFKTRRLLQVVPRLWPDMTGMIKCDDDILPSLFHWREIQQLVEDEHPAYLGKSCFQRKLVTKFSRHHEDIKDLDMEYVLPVCTFAAGPLYYLSREAVKHLQKTIEFCFHEDIMVARHLAAYNISLRPYPIYINTTAYDPFHMVENARNKMQDLYILLHGGLGNLLFQVVGGYSLACKLRMNLILVRGRPHAESKLYTHFHIDDVLSTILLLFNTIHEEEIPPHCRLINLNKKCFEKVEIEHDGSKEPLQVKGYFQHLGYLEDLEQMTAFSSQTLLTQLFLHDTLWKKEILEQYPLLPSRYFLHIRRGDYVQLHQVYSLLSESDYYPRAVQYILDRDPEAFFYIVSDDTDWCYQHFMEDGGRYTSLLPSHQKEIVLLDEFKTLYLMSLCGKGAVCANSTYSWWGSRLQIGDSLIHIFPQQWIHSGNNNTTEINLYPQKAILL